MWSEYKQHDYVFAFVRGQSFKTHIHGSKIQNVIESPARCAFYLLSRVQRLF